MKRTAKGHVNSVRAKLGNAAQIGGIKRVEREAAKLFPQVFAEVLDAKTIKEIFGSFRSISEKAERSPPKLKAPNKNERVKVRWTDDLVARFKLKAPYIRDDKQLAKALGLPEFCWGSMSAARSRYLPRPSTTKGRQKTALGESPAAGILKAA